VLPKENLRKQKTNISLETGHSPSDLPFWNPHCNHVRYMTQARVPLNFSPWVLNSPQYNPVQKVSDLRPGKKKLDASWGGGGSISNPLQSRPLVTPHT
jgi:hypothetical protein